MVQLPIVTRSHKQRPKEFPFQNIFVDNELHDGQRETRTWALALERRSGYPEMEIISEAAWAVSGCGLRILDLPF